MIRYFLLAVLMSVVTGCSTPAPKNIDLPQPPDPSEFKAELGLRRQWSVRLSELPPQSVGYKLVPAVDGSYVYAAGPDGVVVAIEATSGKELWRADLERPVSAGPGVGGGDRSRWYRRWPCHRHQGG